LAGCQLKWSKNAQIFNATAAPPPPHLITTPAAAIEVAHHVRAVDRAPSSAALALRTHPQKARGGRDAVFNAQRADAYNM